MKSTTVGVRVARRLQTAEHAVDKALIETTALIQAMIESRTEAGLAAEVGQPALLNMIHGLTRMAEARGSVVEGHSVLAAVAGAQGIAWRMDGPTETKTQPTGFVAAVAVAA